MDRRNGDKAARGESPTVGRRKKQRRRHIDPTTCERDYSNDEIEFMRAMDDYKNRSGRMFPTCSEVLEVVRELGYVRLDEEQRALLVGEPSIDSDEADDFADALDAEESELALDEDDEQ